MIQNSLYSNGQTGCGKGKGSLGDAEANEGEKSLKLCFQTGKGLGITETFAPAKPVCWIYLWEDIWVVNTQTQGCPSMLTQSG